MYRQDTCGAISFSPLSLFPHSVPLNLILGLGKSFFAAAYAQAHNEMHGTNIETGVILMAVQPKLLADQTYTKPEYLEFVIEGDDFAYWTNEWTKRVELYYLTA